MTAIPNYEFGAYDSFYEPLEAYLDQVEAAAPELVKKSEIGRSREGRSLSLMTITDFFAGKAEDKPALLIFANMHSHELSGPIAALRTLRGVLTERRDLLSHNTFYIIPRINPDGAEKVLLKSGFIRSRWDYSHRVNTMHHEDMDGDGIIAEMRKECPWGNKCLDPDDPSRLIDRTADSQGPFYLYFGEGYLEKWDDILLPPEEIEGDYRDWNRSWPVGWSGTVPQSGDFPCSEPEVYALATFIASHKNIFGTINYHNGWGAIMPPNRVRRTDEKFFGRLTERASRLTGYPALPYGGEYGRKEVPEDPQCYGQFDDFAYHVYGLTALTIELGTIENSAGIRTDEILNQDYSSDFNSRPQVAAYQKAQGIQRKALHDWKGFEHPQLGHVEIGGYDCVGIASPAPGDLARICDAVWRFTCEFAARKPFLKIAHEEKTEVAPGLARLQLYVQNAGDLPTYVMTPGRDSAWRNSPYAELALPEGVKCLSRRRGERLAHFAAWETRVLEYFLRYDPAMPNSVVTLRIEGGAAGNLAHSVDLAR